MFNARGPAWQPEITFVPPFDRQTMKGAVVIRALLSIIACFLCHGFAASAQCSLRSQIDRGRLWRTSHDGNRPIENRDFPF